MRRAVISLVVAVLCLSSGCAYSIQGTPVAGIPGDVVPPFETDTPAPSTSRSTPNSSSAPEPASFDLCELLSWKDLPYEVADKSAPPTKTGYDTEYEQSCSWQTQLKESAVQEVGISLRFREGKALTLDEQTATYDVGGRTVFYLDRSEDPDVQPSCVLVLEYAGGGLGIIAIDGSNKYGGICEQGRKAAEVLLSKEPA
ncbi:DUF3558 family protein [Umezawaea beigongshangensis]|uniref:DUF3558 family protein n=1 Tax=Umezawaea beigongshangensis TaxID=2780383 RepID=UPI0018F15A51|nr:DUF3558 family protein [Umezawaea beigongshangensis]